MHSETFQTFKFVIIFDEHVLQLPEKTPNSTFQKIKLLGKGTSEVP